MKDMSSIAHELTVFRDQYELYTQDKILSTIKLTVYTTRYTSLYFCRRNVMGI